MQRESPSYPRTSERYSVTWPCLRFVHREKSKEERWQERNRGWERCERRRWGGARGPTVNLVSFSLVLGPFPSRTGFVLPDFSIPPLSTTSLFHPRLPTVIPGLFPAWTPTSPTMWVRDTAYTMVTVTACRSSVCTAYDRAGSKFHLEFRGGMCQPWTRMNRERPRRDVASKHPIRFCVPYRDDQVSSRFIFDTNRRIICPSKRPENFYQFYVLHLHDNNARTHDSTVELTRVCF